MAVAARGDTGLDVVVNLRPPHIAASEFLRAHDTAGAYTGGWGGGVGHRCQPPGSFKFRYKNQRHARSLRASTFSRSITAVFHRKRLRRSFNFQNSRI